ncbi:MAG: cytochrome b/b6 domain-containing protein, partial [Hyphomicrobiaceae bacterium]|nr:cytochrome b/b6 domain-containing protein [Hyphomicrobiaceae bacterium]
MAEAIVFRNAARNEAGGDIVPEVETQPIASGRALQPRSDLGTIVIHWTLVTAVAVSLATGLRWSVDAEGSVLNGLIGAYLPQGELWSWHVGAALLATFAMAAYGVYMTAARLRRRVALKRTVVVTMDVSPRLRWSAINVALYWVLFALLATLFVTGVLLYLGHGGVVVDIHYVSALGVAGYVVAH